MHVGLVVPGRLARRTGGCLYDRFLVEHLRAAGERVSVLEIPQRGYGRALAANVRRALERRVVAAGVEVLVEDALAHPALLGLNRRLRRRGGPPVVALVHLLRASMERPAWRRPLVGAVEHAYLAGVDACVSVNEAIRRRILAPRGGTAGALPVHVAAPAGDHVRTTAPAPDFLAARAHSPGPLRVLFLGTLTSLKRPHLVVEAVSRLPPDLARLSLIGGDAAAPGYARRLRRRVAALGAGDRVAFLGELGSDDVGRQLESSHVLAVPSKPESWSIAYLEAFEHGLPVVAHRDSDAAALVEPGRSGFLVGDRDPGELAGVLAGLAQDRDRLAALSLSTREHGYRQPTWSESMETVRQFLRETQRSPPSGGGARAGA